MTSPSSNTETRLVCVVYVLVRVGCAHALRPPYLHRRPYHRGHSCAARPTNHTCPTTDRGDPSHSAAELPWQLTCASDWKRSERTSVVTIGVTCASRGVEEVLLLKSQPQPLSVNVRSCFVYKYTAIPSVWVFFEYGLKYFHEKNFGHCWQVPVKITIKLSLDVD